MVIIIAPSRKELYRVCAPIITSRNVKLMVDKEVFDAFCKLFKWRDGVETLKLSKSEVRRRVEEYKQDKEGGDPYA